MELTVGNLTVLIDDEDYQQIKHLSLGLSEGQGANYYVHVTAGPLKNKKLARILTAAQEGMVVDHKNGNTLDNRKDNLRVCTYSENSQNKAKWFTKELPKGVSKSPYGYRARISPEKGKHVFLGTFTTVDAAKEAYDIAAKLYFSVSRD